MELVGLWVEEVFFRKDLTLVLETLRLGRINSLPVLGTGLYVFPLFLLNDHILFDTLIDLSQRGILEACITAN